MIYVTGDKHGDYSDIQQMCKDGKLSKGDYLIVLGDNGINFFGGMRDTVLKERLSRLPITFILIRGNHDQRPSKKLYVSTDVWNDDIHGTFLIQNEYPNLLFCHEYGSYQFMGSPVFVIGGAYSPDKFFRLEAMEWGDHRMRWFPDEMLTKNEMLAAHLTMRAIVKDVGKFDAIMSHTCPLKFYPDFPPLGFPVDKSMEEWMDKVEETIPYKIWICGHFHKNEQKKNIKFMFDEVASLESILSSAT